MGTVRIALLGGNGVGKTAIAMRFAHGMYIIGGLEAMEVTNSKIMLVNGCCVTVEVTEISDPKLFTHTMDGCLLTYSIDDVKALAELGLWIKAIRRKSEYCPIAILGNKCELENERQVKTEEAWQFA